MRVVVNQPSGSQLFYDVENNLTLKELSQIIQNEEGIPNDLQLFRVPGNDKFLCSSARIELLSNSDTLSLNVLYDLEGGGSDGCKCETTKPNCNLELLCFHCGLQCKFNHAHCCCLDTQCAIL